MAFALYLALTAAELREYDGAYPHLAWMACHFSPYGTGLSNLPTQLPEGSLLMLNDRTPVFGHDPDLVAAQLADAAQRLKCSGILLDFQRPDEPQTHTIADAVCQLPFPVGITPQYAQGRKCAVFLPPLPLTATPEKHLAPWPDREIWLEAATESLCIRVTKEGNQRLPPTGTDLPYPHIDRHLHCRYRIEVQQEYIDFHLCRDAETLTQLMEVGEKLGIKRFVGLYQQLGTSFSQLVAQDTARFQS